MSCGDYIIETMGEVSIKCIKKAMTLVGLCVKGVVHTSELMLRSALYLGESIVQAMKYLYDEHKVSKEVRETEACKRMEELNRMLNLNFEKLDMEIKNNSVYTEELSPQYMKSVVDAYLKIAEVFCDEKEIVFPYNMYQELMALRNIDFLNLDDEELVVWCQRVKAFLDKTTLATERSKAVIFALRGEEYEYLPGFNFSEKEITDSCSELHHIWQDFESVMSCNHLAYNEETIRVKFMNTEVEKVEQVLKKKEKLKNV